MALMQLGYKDSNLEMTESESVALPFGDSPIEYGVFKTKLGYKDSNLEMTESESVALPFGDSPLRCNEMYYRPESKISQHFFGKKFVFFWCQIIQAILVNFAQLNIPGIQL